jgi:hyperosmotically inducible periplasmic protein
VRHGPKIIVAVCLAALSSQPAQAGFVSLAQALTPWSSIYEVARDERRVADIASDKRIATTIKAKLLQKDGKLGLAVKTYCFLGRVMLLGQLSDAGFKRFAVATAKGTGGVRSVSTYWVAPEKKSTTAVDIEIAAKIRAALVADTGVSATQVECEVFGRHVYLLGMVRSQKDAAKSVAHAKAVLGVTRVTSLLTTLRKQ